MTINILMKSQNAHKPLIDTNDAFEGMYVTTCDSSSQTVVSSSSSPSIAYEEAKSKGCDEPVLIYVPTKEEEIFIF